MRPSIIVGNWKMHKTITESLQYVNEFMPLIRDSQAAIYLAVPFTCLAVVSEEVCEAENIQIGAQNMSHHEEGAWTGEVSGKMLKEAGAKFVLLGHSERRQYYAESNALINQKLKLAYVANLQPIVCIGETQQDREQQREKTVIAAQIKESVAGLSLDDAKSLIVAYEPIWAIGTGKNATPIIAQEMHHYCRKVLSEVWDQATAEQIPILYGGSVNPANALQLMLQDDIDGLLVGGASLNAHKFSQIVNANVNNQVI